MRIPNIVQSPILKDPPHGLHFTLISRVRCLSIFWLHCHHYLIVHYVIETCPYVWANIATNKWVYSGFYASCRDKQAPTVCCWGTITDLHAID
ncbi:hypothetical protein EYF80_039634 [Liparis tanakae]|uniref:Uncharacterized protein n=1 Tax=Liparis tanakae TaxID=230148 RepID=A0A4Z2GAP1_9TELE|nr:hypothetical protein EYF80_039634 [Liparis tanakae]